MLLSCRKTGFYGPCTSLPAVSNVGLGLALFSLNFSHFGDLTLLWVYIGYIAFVALNIIFYAGCKLFFKKVNKKSKFAVKMDKAKEAVTIIEGEDEEKERKEASPDACVRWIALAGFFVVSLCIVGVLIVLMVLPQQYVTSLTEQQLES